MFLYYKWVLRRRLLSLSVIITGLYTSLSTFGIVNDQVQEPADNANQPAITTEDSNPYSAIIKANVFHLTDPPKPVEKPDAVLMSLPKINITGFTRRSGQPVHALFATVPKDPKDLPRYFNLSEGEKDDILEVTKIHPNQDGVDVIIAGTPVTLTTKSNSFIQPLPLPPKGGVGPGAMSPPAAVAYHPQPAQPMVPAAAETPYSGGVIVAGGGAAYSTGGANVTTIGANPTSSGLSGGGNGFGSSQGYGGPSYASSTAMNGGSPLQSIPTRPQSMTPAYPPEYHPQTPAESAAMLAVGHGMQSENQGGPPLPPLPNK